MKIVTGYRLHVAGENTKNQKTNSKNPRNSKFEAGNSKFEEIQRTKKQMTRTKQNLFAIVDTKFKWEGNATKNKR